MLEITRVTEAVALFFITVLVSSVGYRLLNGEINTEGLLRRKGGKDNAGVSPERVQLLISTLATAGTYFSHAIAARATRHLPDVPEPLLVGLGASHAIYLAAKAATMFGPSPKKPAVTSGTDSPER